MSYSPKDFYKSRKGPWPQPSPVHPWGESPAVLKLPLSETIDWWLFIGSRYGITLLATPYYLLKGLLSPGLKKVDDNRFEWFFNETMISKFLTNKFDEIDKGIFKSELEEEKDWFIVDLDAVKVVKPFKGIHCSASKTLLYKEGSIFKVKCIYIDETSEIFTFEDGDSWELAKYFVLQGAALCSTLVTHPNQHFPVDSINAIVKTSLPKNHTLYKLLRPHLRFTLALENAVLNYKSSLLNEKWWMVYAPYPGGGSGLRDLLVEGYKGIKGNASYPPFSFPMKAPDVETKYGIYLRTYYSVISKFVGTIISTIPKDDIWTKRWADYVNQHVPDFPSGDIIFKEDNLHKAITSYLFIVTVGHSVDHYNYGELDKREIPLRIRQKPPTKNTKLKNRSKLCSPTDLMKYYMADRLFFSPTTVTSLIDTTYKFKSETNKNAVSKFKKDLVKAEKELVKNNIYYMPLNKIAASIQF
jgi:hypothetical protein